MFNSVKVFLLHYARLPMKSVILVSLILSHASSFAQVPSVIAKTDTGQIRIGEQFSLSLYSTVPKGTGVVFPLIPDTFNHFELVNRGEIDTLSSGNENTLRLQQKITLTSFDSGFFVLPPFPFVINTSKDKSDTLYSEAILVAVKTVPVDTTREIKTIKNIVDVPFPWQDYLYYLFIAHLVTLVVMILYTLLRKKHKAVEVPVIPERPAHEIALEGLKRIEEERIWQQGFTKRYYIEVTDILRQYIERRFSIHAMEQTSDEIIRHFSNSLIRDEEKNKLRFILVQADMVKFAKATPLPSDNETTMAYAYDFIHVTRPVIPEDVEKKEVNK